MFKTFLANEKDIKNTKGDIQTNIDLLFEALLGYEFNNFRKNK